MKPPPIHPGAVLRGDYLEACGISQTSLAVMMNVPPRRINEIVQGLRAITADTAVRLEAALGRPARYWMDLQSDYEIDHARRKGIEAEVRYYSDYGPDPDSLVTIIRAAKKRGSRAA